LNNKMEWLDFLPASLSPTVRTVVYGLIVLHLGIVGSYLCAVGPGLLRGRR
jgi:hypothetical protein